VRALSQATASARARGLAAADAGCLATVCGAWVFRLLVRLRCFEGLEGQVTCYYTSAQAEPTATAASTASKRRGVSCPRPRTFRRLRRAESRAIADAHDGGCVTYVSLHYRPARPSRLREALTRYEGQALLRWAWAHVRGEWARRRGDARARPPAFRRPFRTPGMERDDLGVFVTFSDRRSGALRGCLGTVDNAERLPLADAVAYFAVQAGFHDPRPGLTRDRPLREGEGVRLEVTLLGARTPLRSIADWRIHRDGLYLERHGAPHGAPHASAVFLPSVATEQGWDRRTTLAHLVAKAEGRGGEPDPEVLAGGDAAVRRYALYAVPGRAFAQTPTAAAEFS
jgi:AMMECR1 domain-containing protein